MEIKELLALFNKVAMTGFNLSYQQFEPKFNGLLYEYESGPVASMDFPFTGFIRGIEEFKGSRNHNIFPDGYKFSVANKEWDMSVDIKRADFERAAFSPSPLSNLGIYRQRINEMPMLFKDHPVELAFSMMEVGDGTTLGTSFDGQAFYSETHSYGTSSGSLSNIITNGSGVTAANIHTDILRALSRFNTFTFGQGGKDVTSTDKMRKLNKSMNNLLIVAPDQLYGVLYDLKNKERLATGESNTLKGQFDFTTLPFTDTDDWYISVLDDPFFRPFLKQIEKPAELDSPTLQDDRVRDSKVFTWGGYGRYNTAYGAWWTSIMIQN